MSRFKISRRIVLALPLTLLALCWSQSIMATEAQNDLESYSNAGSLAYSSLRHDALFPKFNRQVLTSTASDDFVPGKVIYTYVDRMGQFYHVGNTDSANPRDTYLAKYNASGEKHWTRNLDKPGDMLAAFAVTADFMGNVIIVGFASSSVDGQSLTGNSDVFIRKYNSQGIKQWTRLLGSKGSIATGTSVTVDSYGNIYVAGQTSGLEGNTPIGIMDGFIAKFSSNGTKQWVKEHGVTKRVSLSRVQDNTATGTIALLTQDFSSPGETTTASRKSNMTLISYDLNGEELWGNNINPEQLTWAISFATDLNNSVLVSGCADCNLFGNSNDTVRHPTTIMKFDSSGFLKWTKDVGPYGNRTLAMVTADSEGNVLVGGNIFSSREMQYNAGTVRQDRFIFKYDSYGMLLSAIIEHGSENSDASILGISSGYGGNVFLHGVAYGRVHGNILPQSSGFYLARHNLDKK